MRRIAAALLFPVALAAQTGAILGRVTARATGEALGYAVVGIDGSPRSWFATDSGQFFFGDLVPGRRTLLVRRLGYTPKTVVVDVRAGETATVAVAMDRVAVSLDRVVVTAQPACTAPGIKSSLDTAIVPIVEQLVLNAEQARLMASQYPYQYFLEVRRVRIVTDSMMAADDIEKKSFESRVRTSYRPGMVLQRINNRWQFLIPELQDIADPMFLDSHCWRYAGIDTIDGQRHYQIDVIAADKLVGVDMNARFFINASSFTLRRSIARLARWPTALAPLASFVTTTDFYEILAGIPVISQVLTLQTFQVSPRNPFREVREEQKTVGFEFKDRKPGDPQRP